jgi:hypothetical protein
MIRDIQDLHGNTPKSAELLESILRISPVSLVYEVGFQMFGTLRHLRATYRAKTRSVGLTSDARVLQVLRAVLLAWQGSESGAQPEVQPLKEILESKSFSPCQAAVV